MFDWLIGPLSSALGQVFSNLWNSVSSSIWNIFLQWLYKQIFDAIADFFTKMGDMGLEMFGLSWVQATLKLFSLFGWALFVAGLVVMIFDVAIESQTGRMNALNVLKGFFAVNLFTVLPVELYKFCITLQNIFSKDLATIFSSSALGSYSIIGAENAALTTLTGMPSFFNLCSMIALGYCVIKIFFANIQRGGILLIQIAVGSLFMFSIPRGYTDGFIRWCKQVIALCLTAFLQTTLLYLGLLTWQTNWLLAIGIMMASSGVPRIAQEFGLDTAAKVSIMNVVHTTTTAINLTRSLTSK